MLSEYSSKLFLRYEILQGKESELFSLKNNFWQVLEDFCQCVTLMDFIWNRKFWICQYQLKFAANLRISPTDNINFVKFEYTDSFYKKMLYPHPLY